MKLGVMSRALRNVFRKKVRTIGVILIIGFSLCVFITMSTVNANINERATQISKGTENTVTIRPAGTYGGYGGGGFGGFSMETMNESILQNVESVDHIESIQKVITQMEGQMGSPGSGTRPTNTRRYCCLE